MKDNNEIVGVLTEVQKFLNGSLNVLTDLLGQYENELNNAESKIQEMIDNAQKLQDHNKQVNQQKNELSKEDIEHLKKVLNDTNN